jgi:hypothetical protein
MPIDLNFFRSVTSERIRAQGFEEGFAEAFPAGFAERRLLARARTVLWILNRRGIGLDDDARERILRCTDRDELGLWFERALTAIGAGDLFV